MGTPPDRGARTTQRSFGPLIQEDIDRVAREVPGVEDVDVELTFDPPWTPDKMSDDAKFILGFG